MVPSTVSLPLVLEEAGIHFERKVGQTLLPRCGVGKDEIAASHDTSRQSQAALLKTKAEMLGRGRWSSIEQSINNRLRITHRLDDLRKKRVQTEDQKRKIVFNKVERWYGTFGISVQFPIRITH
uniref:Uncharacterized protein n=1 Tax=Lygus hesperus TaxID=30085 RepID=A0A146LB00_LYGHE